MGVAPTLDASTEFQQRRRRTWRAVRWWLLATVVAGLLFAMGPVGSDRTLSQAQFSFMMICFFVAAVAMILVIRGVTTYYRCPNCNKIPMTGSFSAGLGGISYRRGVDLNPTECSHCGARLKPADL